MLSNNLFRFAGYAAILSAVLTVVAIGVGITSDMNNMLGLVCSIASSILFVPVVYALYLVHRAQSPGLALAAAILTIVGDIASIFFDPAAPANAPLSGIITVILGIGVLLFGWLAFGNNQMPRGIPIVVWLAGGLVVLSGILFLIGSVELGGLVSFASVIPFIVWAVWLGTYFLSQKFATA